MIVYAPCPSDDSWTANNLSRWLYEWNFTCISSVEELTPLHYNPSIAARSLHVPMPFRIERVRSS